MPLKISSSNLPSRKIRKRVGSGSGKRIFKKNGYQSNNLVVQIWNSAKNFVTGFLSNAFDTLLSGISLTFSTLWGLIVSATTQVYNFDWNVSGEELNKAVVDKFNSLGNEFGLLAGTGAGYLTCGALPGAVIAYFNKPLGIEVLKTVGESALDELSSNFSSLLYSIFEFVGQAAFAYLYQNVKNLVRGTDLEFRNKLIKSGVKLADVEKAAEKRTKPYVFSQKIENKISKVNNEFAKNFLSSFLEQFGESCIEAGYVVAGNVDDYIARQKISRDPLFGQEENLTIEFDSNDNAVVKKENDKK